MIRISIDLQEDERQALIEVANREKRHPRQQAAMLIRRELERRGLLPAGDGAAEFTEVQHATAVN